VAAVVAAAPSAPTVAAPVETAGTPDELFRAGVAFAKQGDFAQATRSLKTAAYAVAPRAMVTLAQVYAQGLRDPASAAQLYRETTRRFPDTDAARFAREQLQAGDAA
jgi:TolA-binding protein